MARRSPSMIVTTAPGNSQALTNFAYCSPSDIRNFKVPGFDVPYALIDDVFVLSISHEFISNGQIALNGIQRRQAKVSSGDPVTVGRFILAEDFNLALLSLQLELVRRGPEEEHVSMQLYCPNRSGKCLKIKYELDFLPNSRTK